MVQTNSPLLQLLQRNENLFAGKSVIFAGDITDPALLQLTKGCAAATVLCDHFGTAQRMAAMLGQSQPARLHSEVSYRHISLSYTARQLFAPAKADLLCLLLHKTKSVNQALLASLAPYLNADGMILAAAANEAGGKSADSLLKAHGSCFKADSARKCTLWQLHFDASRPFAHPADALVLTAAQKSAFLECLKTDDFSALVPECAGTAIKAPRLNLELPEVTDNSAPLSLLQDCQVFSPGRVDEGSAMLLQATACLCTQQQLTGKTALDLCCGCGLIGIALAHCGLKCSACDVSAAALFLSALNLCRCKLPERACSAYLQPSDLLADLNQAVHFDLIAVNPPFHQGVARNDSLSNALFASAGAHLNPEGTLLVVGNTCLKYPERLQQFFTSCTTICHSTRFNVSAARQPRQPG